VKPATAPLPVAWAPGSAVDGKLHPGSPCFEAAFCQTQDMAASFADNNQVRFSAIRPKTGQPPKPEMRGVRRVTRP